MIAHIIISFFFLSEISYGMLDFSQLFNQRTTNNLLLIDFENYFLDQTIYIRENFTVTGSTKSEFFMNGTENQGFKIDSKEANLVFQDVIFTLTSEKWCFFIENINTFIFIVKLLEFYY